MNINSFFENTVIGWLELGAKVDNRGTESHVCDRWCSVTLDAARPAHGGLAVAHHDLLNGGHDDLPLPLREAEWVSCAALPYGRHRVQPLPGGREDGIGDRRCEGDQRRRPHAR